jgi:hypothetical protein
LSQGLTIIASEAKQSIVPQGRMDCFVAEPVIGRAFARPVGSLAQRFAFVAGNDEPKQWS